tara:strand:+ start:275 stop:445 length:171 start_codon:yes stop_codon:yes gene_type:complete
MTSRSEHILEREKERERKRESMREREREREKEREHAQVWSGECLDLSGTMHAEVPQ